MPALRFLFGVHNHQPIGNIDAIIERLVARAYRPFLDALATMPILRVSLHVSGPLLTWLEGHDAPYLEALGRLVERGQVELLTAGIAEPILAAIPPPDRVGQIAAMQARLRRRFGVTPRGLWLTERVWEPDLAADIAAAGIAYAIVDGRSFQVAGFAPEALHGYYLTEADGQRLALFPIDKALRYLIPFRPAADVAAYLRRVRDTGGALAIFADDGEKYGGWPGTYDWVYERGWLREFVAMLGALAREDIVVSTFGEALDAVAPAGLCYLPTSSYAELEEWALPPERQADLRRLAERLGPDAARYDALVRGGHWKHFLVRYPEANRMHKKMLALSALARERRASPRVVEDLYAAQCNDAYWHGLFGGLYVPHLRQAVWQRLARVERALRRRQDLRIEVADVDVDGRQEVAVSSRSVSALIAPVGGGALVEYIPFALGVNLLATLARRPEAYHRRELASHGPEGEGIPSIHDLARLAAGAAERDLVYDPSPRAAFLDHIVPASAVVSDCATAVVPDEATLVTAAYACAVTSEGARLTADGRVPGRGGVSTVRVTKEFAFDAAGHLTVRYRVENTGPVALAGRWGVEMNVAPASLGTGEGYLEVAGKHAPLDGPFESAPTSGATVVDVAAQARLRLTWSQPAAVWMVPVHTLSQSESGLQRSQQAVMLLAHWPLTLAPGSAWGVDVRWEAVGVRRRRTGSRDERTPG